MTVSLRSRQKSHLIACLAPAALILLCSAPASAQTWLDRLTIRETLDAKYAARPASVQLAMPAGESRVVNVNAGVRYTFSTAFADFGPFADYQRSTETAKPQDVLKAGLSGERLLFDIGANGAPATPVIMMKINFKRDGVKDTEGIEGALSSSVIARGCAMRPSCAWKPGVITDASVIAFRYLPHIGLEYERASPEDGEDHRVVRGTLVGQVQVYPLPHLFDYQLQLTADYTYRRSDRQETSLQVRDHRRFDAGINIFLLVREREEEPGRAAGIGISYTYGADPSNGLERQEVTKLAFKVQI